MRGEYQVTLDEKKTSLITGNVGEAKALMAKVEEVEIRLPLRLDPESIQLRIKLNWIL